MNFAGYPLSTSMLMFRLRQLPSILLLFTVLLFGSSTHAKSNGDTRSPRFALVIGSNAPSKENQETLKYADDDAAAITELLTEYSVHVELLTTFDRESQSIYPRLVKSAHRPTKPELLAAYSRILRKMNRAKRRGKSPELIIYYSGHGNVSTDGQGYLTLEGAKFSRQDLFSTLLEKSPASHHHLLIDACLSEELILSRGPNWKPDRADPKYQVAVDNYLDLHRLDNFPNTGVLLAHSIDQQTHEWERYRGGIFTHQLLSGLRGGADINGDGNIEYSELAAFVSAANSGVKDPRARLQVTVRPPPDDHRTPIVSDEKLEHRRILLFNGPTTHRFSLEDRRGVRLADLNRSGPHPAYLRLPPGPLFLSRHPHASQQSVDESTIEASKTGIILAKNLAFAPSKQQSRGAIEQAFRKGLFSVGYGNGYYSGFIDTKKMLSVADPEWKATIWQKVDGTWEEKTTIETNQGEPKIEVSSNFDSDTALHSPQQLNQDKDNNENKIHIKKTDDDKVDDKSKKHVWGAVTIGTIFSPFPTGEAIRLPEKRVIANEADAWAGPLRGLDLRWHTFWLRKKSNRRWWLPGSQWYFRTGYTQGEIQFSPETTPTEFQVGDPTLLKYLTVPLFFGGNVYLFDRFPLRPYAGLGAGFDILRVHYRRFSQSAKIDTSARIGFELHAGIELRIANYVLISGEISQLWSARRKISKLPDYSNEGFTLTTSIGLAFPLNKTIWSK